MLSNREKKNCLSTKEYQIDSKNYSSKNLESSRDVVVINQILLSGTVTPDTFFQNELKHSWNIETRYKPHRFSRFLFIFK
jgi:hypothetical protein